MADELFSEHFSPLKLAFLHVPDHYLALLAACDSIGSADEMVALSHEWQLVASGARDTLGQPCLCRQTEKWPEAIRIGRAPGDTKSALIGLVADLDRAADTLPDAWLHWPSVRKVYWTQQRSGDYFRRVGARRSPPEREPELDGRSQGRRLVWRTMAECLGWRPRPGRVDPPPTDLAAA